MKKFLFIFLILFFLSCDRYESIDTQTRLNKWSQNFEQLQPDGSWSSNKRRKIPEDQWSNIIIDYIRFSDGWGCIITNNSSYTIHSIELEMDIEDKETNQHLYTRELTCSSGLLRPFSIRNYIPCSPQPPDLLKNQSWNYHVKKIQGFIESKVDL